MKTGKTSGNSPVQFYFIDHSQNKLMVEIIIDSKIYKLTFDSGSALSFLNDKFLEKLNMELTAVDTVVIRLVNGTLIRIEKALIVEISFDEFTFTI